MGGLGSLWGTLAGGVLLGIAQAIGGQINVGLPFIAGHVAFLLVLIVRPQGLFPEGVGDEREGQGSRRATAGAGRPFDPVEPHRHDILACAHGGARRSALLGRPPDDASRSPRSIRSSALASLWNFLAGYAGLVSVGQQTFVGLGGYTLYLCALWAGLNPMVGLPLAGVHRRR